jgi:hypothetical protein
MGTSIRKHYFDKIPGLMLLVLSFTGIWQGVLHGYPLINLMLVIIIPYTIAIILGGLQLVGKKWVQIPIILMCIFGLLLNTFETIQCPNKKDIIEIAVFFVVLAFVTADYVKKDCLDIN